ncbi:hypothetical protein LTR84_007288 [Exophiala bonariae]|uniref:Transcription factor domain-containing protein n=1 Tax=Exophiala bonariae TaxID=1690606 RepID=A0AAV9MYZ1_9EURO|nr:hypothetical protein LTR84_007288 [Exophiala bonariae]
MRRTISGCFSGFATTLNGEEYPLGIHAEEHSTNLLQPVSRDLLREIDGTLPRSNLAQFEEHFSLPLPCDEADNKERPPHVNTHFVFFLAEMSLRAILESILTTPELNAHSSPASIHQPYQLNISPVQQELHSQLDTWILRLPANLDWSPNPVPVPTNAYSERSPLTTRLKLLYWYARFALHRPLMLQTLDNGAVWSHLPIWEPFREGLLPALNLLKIFATEQPDIDVIMANRVISAIDMMTKITSKMPFPAFNGENADELIRTATNMLMRKFGTSSDWVVCKLANLQVNSRNGVSV